MNEEERKVLRRKIVSAAEQNGGSAVAVVGSKRMSYVELLQAQAELTLIDQLYAETVSGCDACEADGGKPIPHQIFVSKTSDGLISLRKKILGF